MFNSIKKICSFPAYDWTCDERMGGGILTLVGSHIIDLLSHLTGLKATRFVFIAAALLKKIYIFGNGGGLSDFYKQNPGYLTRPHKIDQK
jgi:hypothetical protein